MIGNIILIICQYDIPADKAFEWTQKIFENIQPQKYIFFLKKY